MESETDAFAFDNYVIDLKGLAQFKLKVYFKNIDHIGEYYEKYVCNVFEQADEENQSLVGVEVKHWQTYKQ